VTLGFSPEGNRLAARLNVLCRSDRDAALTAAVLTKITEVLRTVIAKSGQKPSPNDLSGPLTLGSFQSKGSRVFRLLAHRAGFRGAGAGGAVVSSCRTRRGYWQRPLGQTGISADLEPPPACAAKVECSCARCFCPQDGHSA